MRCSRPPTPPSPDGTSRSWSSARWSARPARRAARQCPLRSRCAWQLAGAPPYDGRPHPVQAWHGTDRQVRGRLLAALRASSSRPLHRAALAAACPDESLRDPAQRDRCLDGLVADGLVEPLPRGRFRPARREPADLPPPHLAAPKVTQCGALQHARATERRRSGGARRGLV